MLLYSVDESSLFKFFAGYGSTGKIPSYFRKSWDHGIEFPCRVTEVRAKSLFISVILLDTALNFFACYGSTYTFVPYAGRQTSPQESPPVSISTASLFRYTFCGCLV